MASEEIKNNDKRRNILVIIIVLLALANGYFGFSNYQAKKKNKYLEAKRHELDSLYTGVSAELNAKGLELAEMKGKNATLDSIIAVREAELAETQKEIDELLRKNKLSAADLNSVKKLVRTLQDENDKYMNDIDILNKKLAALTNANDSLRTSLVTEISSNQKLSAEQKILSRKAEQGALLKPENIKGTGIKVASNNTETETNSAKKSNKLKICFDVPASRVAESGEKEILVRIINPSGTTLALENQGSGVFTNVETNETTQYTSTVKFEYDKKTRNVCTNWQQNTDFVKGTYKVLFYQNGYFLNEGSFILK
jgi:hypothetical protein